MLKIRLKRTGRKNAPSYRIVVVDARSPRDGKAIEEVGWYNPSEDVNKIVYNKERFEYWTSCGAQMTKAVKKLIEGKYEYIPYSGSEHAETEGSKQKEEQQQTQQQ